MRCGRAPRRSSDERWTACEAEARSLHKKILAACLIGIAALTLCAALLGWAFLTAEPQLIALLKSASEVSEAKLVSLGLRPFEIPEYELAEQEALHMPGGNWLSRRYVKTADVEVDRAALRRRLSEALVSSGWAKAELPKKLKEYFPIKMYETSGDDLYYTHPPFTADDNVIKYHMAIHVSENADIVALYYDLLR